MSLASRRPLPLLLAALALLAALGFSLIPATAVASGGCQAIGATTIYYSKPHGGREVGRYRADCQGNCTGSGAITPYYEVTLFLPCAPPPGDPEP